MVMNNFEHELQRQLDTLPKEKQPQRDLWKGIELSLEAENPAESRSGLHAKHIALAASFALVAMVSWFTFKPIEPQTHDSLTGQSLVTALSNQHQQQMNALLVKFEGQPAVTENWQQQLQELDSAANAIKAALEEDPDNTALLKMLQNVYQQQMMLVERVHAPKWQQI
ncbi:hypothetical protein OPS25_11660 [Alteromonas ponticola]|uniref:Anti-sigma factor n=1 Tax=Alteromonas aquimaris TaxID=2998417 RepID=A0ABT3P8S5_9ALTE|nr:hypothetical protein [Alteromonas aquimaris]MCW8109154.1 hypothetical protein [Alteromonas aquimaris]